MAADSFFSFVNINIEMMVPPSLKEFARACWCSKGGKPLKHAVDRGDFCQNQKWSVSVGGGGWTSDNFPEEQPVPSLYYKAGEKTACPWGCSWLETGNVFMFGCKILSAAEQAALWIRWFLVLDACVTVGTWSLLHFVTSSEFTRDGIGGIIGQHALTAV